MELLLLPGHQLNLFTGPIFFLYKILTTIKLSEQLTNQRNFYCPGLLDGKGEDHDMDEIRFVSQSLDKKLWKTNWNGASGQISMYRNK